MTILCTVFSLTMRTDLLLPEICLKKAGWNAYYIPDASIIHFGGRSMNRWKRRRMVYRGKMLFYKNNYGLLRTGILRIMLGILSSIKLLFWALIWILPNLRERAKLELDSNLDVIKLCIKLE